jgi:hypothetical protein
MLGAFASKAGDEQTLDYYNHVIDSNHDRLITSEELSHLESRVGISRDDWRFMMAFHQGGGYQVDDAIGAMFDPSTRARITPPRLDVSMGAWNPDFNNDSNLRLHGDDEGGRAYSRRQDREDYQREIHKYEDPKRGIAIGKLALYVLLPEVAAILEAFKAGLQTGQAIGGRDFSGNKLSDDERSAKLLGGILGFGNALVIAGARGQLDGALDDLANVPSGVAPRSAVPPPAKSAPADAVASAPPPMPRTSLPVGNVDEAAGAADDAAVIAHSDVGSSQVAHAELALFKTKPLRSEYVGEHLALGSWHGEPTVVRYLDPVERESYRLTVRGGRLYDESGQLFDTRSAASLHSDEARAIFVMDVRGNIYASLRHAKGEFHHSSFLAGDPVAGAGEIVVENGYLRMISNRSGHYRPNQEINRQVVENLRGLGVNTDRVVVEGF